MLPAVSCVLPGRQSLLIPAQQFSVSSRSCQDPLLLPHNAPAALSGTPWRPVCSQRCALVSDSLCCSVKGPDLDVEDPHSLSGPSRQVIIKVPPHPHHVCSVAVIEPGMLPSAPLTLVKGGMELKSIQRMMR